jgi:hypothetical protein
MAAPLKTREQLQNLENGDRIIIRYEVEYEDGHFLYRRIFGKMPKDWDLNHDEWEELKNFIKSKPGYPYLQCTIRIVSFDRVDTNNYYCYTAVLASPIYTSNCTLDPGKQTLKLKYLKTKDVKFMFVDVNGNYTRLNTNSILLIKKEVYETRYPPNPKTDQEN